LSRFANYARKTDLPNRVGVVLHDDAWPKGQRFSSWLLLYAKPLKSQMLCTVVVSALVRSGVLRFFVPFEAFLESANTLAQLSAQFGDPTGAEDQKGEHQDNDKFYRSDSEWHFALLNSCFYTIAAQLLSVLSLSKSLFWPDLEIRR
jgi:hypothetical protein